LPKKGIVPYSDIIKPYNGATSIGKIMLRIQRKRIVASVLPRRRSADIEEVTSQA
jgi:hypothetical protein